MIEEMNEFYKAHTKQLLEVMHKYHDETDDSFEGDSIDVILDKLNSHDNYKVMINALNVMDKIQALSIVQTAVKEWELEMYKLGKRPSLEGNSN